MLSPLPQISPDDQQNNKLKPHYSYLQISRGVNIPTALNAELGIDAQWLGIGSYFSCTHAVSVSHLQNTGVLVS
jgi:hypothetical protein